MLITLAEYRPDVADVNSAFTADLSNVICSSGAYIPFKQFAAITEALPEEPLGWLGVKTMDGTIRFFAGTASNLYILNGTTLAWDEVSQVTDGYSANRLSRWSIKAFGPFIIAVNANDPPQVYDVTTDIIFRDLGGSPPTAARVHIWGDFVALSGIQSQPNRVQWSGLNDCEFWTPGSQNSDYQDFPDGGRVQGTSDTTNPLVFMESAIYRATFVPGSVEIFTFQKVHDKRGAFSPSSIASRGSATFFADSGGFFQIDADGSLTPIGFEKVDRTVFSVLSASSVSEIMGAIDPFYSRVYWALDYTGSGTFDRIIVYDWQLGQWTLLQVNILGIASFITFGYTLEALDDISASLDALPFSLDSKQWQGGAPLLAAFDTSFRLGSFSGQNVEATVTTPEVGATDGTITRTTSSYPVVDCDNVWVSIGVRMRRGEFEPVTWLPEQTRSGNTGKIRKRSRARFHRMQIRIPEGENWTRLSGIDVDTSEAGSR